MCNMFCSFRIQMLILMMLTQVKAEMSVSHLTSSYSQVSRSGPALTSASQARSHPGKTWIHSSNRNKPDRRFSTNIKEKLPHFQDGTGEVVEDRFNPRPWFSYESIGSKDQGPEYIPPNKPITDLSPPFDKPAVLLKPVFDNMNKSPAVASEDSYGSPYDSYNSKQQSTNLPHPSNFVTPGPGNEYLPPFEPEREQENLDHFDSSRNNSDKENNDNDNMDLIPPSMPYKSHPEHNIVHHDPNYDKDLSPPSEAYKYHPEPTYPYQENDPNVHSYSFHHNYPHDHPPVYYEVKTTTTEASENQRLNKRPYSYYYIGRKLWYIPLYFSVYFIIYIFVLILKSIARHKITFNQYFEDDKREMKDMHVLHDEHVHELEHHVLSDIISAKTKYIM